MMRKRRKAICAREADLRKQLRLLVAERNTRADDLTELLIERDQLKIDNGELCRAIQHQCNWLQGLVGVNGKADALCMGSMIDKMRYALTTNETYSRSKPLTHPNTLRGAQ